MPPSVVFIPYSWKMPTSTGAVAVKGGGAVRHAEKKRNSTCRFADEVASVCIDAFRTCCTENTLPPQTVLSGFVLRRDNGTLMVASLGVGTKFLSHSVLSTSDTSSVVRDCHAEVLARRGFLKFVLGELSAIADGGTSDVFVLNEDGLFSLRSSVTIHLYTSSQPCGNACLKRWGKSKKENCVSEDATTFPQLPSHPWKNFPAIKQGEVAILLKKDPSDEETSEVAVSCDGKGVVAPGTIRISDAHHSSIRSCSAKIASWNALGYEGSRLSRLLRRIHVSTITIGRKFGRPHAERALCCRLQSFTPKKEKKMEHIQHTGISHPSIYCTSVVFDDSVIVTGDLETDSHGELSSRIGANFESSECLCWWKGRSTAERLDARTGRVMDTGVISAVSTASFEESFLRICLQMKKEKLASCPVDDRDESFPTPFTLARKLLNAPPHSFKS